MSDPRPIRWPRPLHGAPSSRRARLDFTALLTGPRVDQALEQAQGAVAAADWEALDVQLRVRGTDLGRLDELLAGRAGLALQARSEHERLGAARCARYLCVQADLADPPALGALAAALALLRALADEGDLLLAVDGVTGRWWAPDELLSLPAARPFDVDEHLQVVVEAVERRPGAGHLVRTRGLRKFARPDVCGRVARRDAERISELVRDLGRLLAEGDTVAPGDRVRVANLPALTLLPRSDDGLADAPADEAPLYELRDLGDDGRPGPDCARLLSALRPRPRLRVLR